MPKVLTINADSFISLIRTPLTSNIRLTQKAGVYNVRGAKLPEDFHDNKKFMWTK